MNCACGCGQDAGVYTYNKSKSIAKGKPKKYINGHTRKGFRATHCKRGHPRTFDNLTPQGACRTCSNVSDKRWANKNKEKVNAKRAKFRKDNPDYDRDHRRKVRIEALKHYGGKCTCCNISNYEFLSFDHINGGGSKHRRELKLEGQKFLYWLRRNNYPETIRLLCHNCNVSLGMYGYCPHRPEIKMAVIRRPRKETQ